MKKIENPNFLAENRMQPRTRFMSYQSMDAALNYDETASQYYHDLSGTWSFQLVDCPEATPEAFLNGHYKKLTWQVIQVPGEIELQGYGEPNYTNVDYPFPVNPPYIPAENPCGLYYREFDFKSTLSQQFLRFEGVDSAFDVWLNGIYVGYSQGSRLMSEFDITDKIKKGNNQLAIRVYKWSDGSYLEDQDQWWLSGIFRKVTLIEEDATGFSNIMLSTIQNNEQWLLNLSLQQHHSTAFNEFVLHVFDNHNQEIYHHQHVLEEQTATIETIFNHVKTWNDELPTLYTLILEQSPNVYIPIRFGFREVLMENGLICLNHVPVLFNGVNRHEFDPKTGRCLTHEQIRQELNLIKSYGINAIRTSHYPNDPYFYDCCDEIGLMVIDECDLEAHGIPSDILLANDSVWAAAFLDRAERMVYRDFNHPCILIWSLGNESGFGPNFIKMANHVKSIDPNRLIHYEQDKETVVADMYSLMYPSIANLRTLADKKTHKKPIILCEYGHAMGNGPGSLQDYQNLFRRFDCLQGGFIWEWKDHGLLHKDEHGQQEFAYGGDFNERVNDGEFVIDGLMRPDLIPSPGLIEYASVIQPLAVKYTNGYALVTSHYHFATEANLHLKWQLTNRQGQVFSGVNQVQFDLAPQADELIKIEFSKEALLVNEGYLTITIINNSQKPILGQGNFTYQQLVKPVDKRKVKALYVTEDHTKISMNSTKTQVTINRITGNLQQIILNGESLLDEQVQLSLWRLPISNDRNIKQYWHDHYIDDLITRSTMLRYCQSSDCVWVQIQQYLAPPVQPWGIQIFSDLVMTRDGALSLNHTGYFEGEFPNTFPRIGYDWPLKKVPSQIEWFGRGAGENYPDSLQATPIGVYTKTLSQWRFPYVVPQDTGNRSEVTWLNLVLPSDQLVSIHSLQPINFNILPQNEQLLGTHYQYEKEAAAMKHVKLRFDSMVRGLGSQSCGPEPLPAFLGNVDSFQINYQMS